MQYFYAFECTFETKCPKVEAVLSQCRLPFFSCPALSTFFVQSIDIDPVSEVVSSLASAAFFTKRKRGDGGLQAVRRTDLSRK